MGRDRSASPLPPNPPQPPQPHPDPSEVPDTIGQRCDRIACRPPNVPPQTIRQNFAPAELRRAAARQTQLSVKTLQAFPLVFFSFFAMTPKRSSTPPQTPIPPQPPTPPPPVRSLRVHRARLRSPLVSLSTTLTGVVKV